MPDRAEYLKRCSERWHSWALTDARRHWATWVELHDRLITTIALPYLRDCWARDLAGTCHNSSGTLTGYCWMMAPAFAAEPGMLGPLVDFNESSQTCFLSRGLVIYLAICLEELDKSAADGQPRLALDGVK